MSIRDAYSLWSTTYDSDRNLTRDLDQLATKSSLGDKSYLNVIEIGCGTGKNTAFLARIARTILAIDFSTGMLRQARLKVDSDNVGFVVADLTSPWPCKQNFFELIVCNLVLEHVENLGPIFHEASQALAEEGLFFISELHPFRQYKGTQANFQREDTTTEIPAFVHHLSDFTDSAEQNGFSLRAMKEWWHDEDHANLPRLISFTFQKQPQKGT
ncbi:MAG TPA: class I SAM-dependent methyltransferase [Pyrinomonadaceae bacterium]